MEEEDSVRSKNVQKGPYLNLRLKLLAIIVGALLAVWVILLLIVYSLMTNELYRELDGELRLAAIRLIHNYDLGRTNHGNPISFETQDTNYSLWRIEPSKSNGIAEFVDGNPFVNVRSLYKRAINSSDNNSGYYFLSIAGIRYRAFYTLVNDQKGTYLIRITQPTAPTDSTLNSLLETLGVTGVLALALTIAVGIFLTNRSITPMIVSWKRQQQFVADASHELRTPLTIIKTNLDILLRSPDHTIESEMKYLGNAYGEVLRTSSLIEDLLTLARADSQEQLVEKKPVNLNQLASDVVETVQPLAIEQNKELTVISPRGVCNILGDVARLRQLLLILLDNAIRYTDSDDQIIVTIECSTQFSTLTVTDTGAGIEPSLLPTIFDRFVRGESTRNHRSLQPGSGLGLAIAQWIVEAHHGTITATSSVGIGTTITVVLPP